MEEKMKKRYVINGRFMEDRMHGLVRYSRELTSELDKLLDNTFDIILLIPPTAKAIPAFRNIKIKKIGTCGGILWEQTALRKYLKQNHEYKCINLSNVAPLFVQPGITAILDIMYKVNPSHYTTPRNRISRLWHIFQYSYITKHEEAIITISDFCKGEIEKHYPNAKGKIHVIPCAWQHVLSYKENKEWDEKYPFLKDGQFFFSLATLSKNKNGKWIMEAAKNNPNAAFAIAGKHYETEYESVPENVHLLGYISDEDACALMKHCRAFIFPSLYEGFGLPPLEALALGANVIASNTTSLPEVLGKSVHYIDPLNPNVDLEALLSRKTEDRNNVLNRYSWEKSANKLKNILVQYSS